MEQIDLELGLERPTEPAIPLDPDVQERLVALMAGAIIAVHQAEGAARHHRRLVQS
jgi:hypothetical protein